MTFCGNFNGILSSFLPLKKYKSLFVPIFTTYLNILSIVGDCEKVMNALNILFNKINLNNYEYYEVPQHNEEYSQP